MSVNYADGLSPYMDKGVCGLPEKYDSPEMIEEKVKQLATWMQSSSHVVALTGAGVSTSAGIPDFRGPNGVWTLEKVGVKPEVEVTFQHAHPTVTHMALVGMERKKHLHYLVGQNIDGLHMRSGFPRDRMSELHGNMFIEECKRCGKRVVLSQAVSTMARNLTGNRCEETRDNDRRCRGQMIDTILDWEDALPVRDMDMAFFHARQSDLFLCLGTSLRIVPAADLPLHSKKNKGKIVIVNLQDTKHEKHCDLRIYARVDGVMKRLCELLDVEIPEWRGVEIVENSTHSLPKHLDYDLVKVEDRERGRLKRSENRKRRREDVKVKKEEEPSTSGITSLPAVEGALSPPLSSSSLTTVSWASSLLTSDLSS